MAQNLSHCLSCARRPPRAYSCIGNGSLTASRSTAQFGSRVVCTKTSSSALSPCGQSRIVSMRSGGYQRMQLQLMQHPASQLTGKIAAAASYALLWSMPGAALAASEQAKAPEMPPLPSPPEIVRKLSGVTTNDTPSQTAPSLTDSPSDTPEKLGRVSADSKAGADKTGNDTQEDPDMKRNQELRANFEDTILPKIARQLKELDENEEPNDITIDLRRQLRRAEDDIYRLLRDLKGSNSDAIRAEATGLQREFADIREYVKRHGGTLVEE